MAYVANQEEDEQSQNNQVAPSGGAGVHLAPSAGVGAVGSGAGTSGNGQGAGGGSFATIDKYLSANQGQAAPLAGQITGNIQNQYNSLDRQNQSVAQGVQGQVDQGYTKQNSDLLSQEAANPVSFSGDTNNVTGFKGQLNDKYTGPQSAESTSAFTGQQANINNAIDSGKASTQTEAGREGLLQGLEGNKSNGVTALNSAILSQDPNAQSSIENAYKPFSNLVSGLNASGQQIDQNIAGATKEAQNASQTANTQLQNQFNGLSSGLNTKLNDAQGAVNNYNTGISNYQTGMNANQPIIGSIEGSGLLKQLNIDDPFSKTYSNLAAPTMNSVASQNDLATQQALSTLGGQNTNVIDPNSAVGGYTAPGALPTVPNQAGFQSLLDQISGGISPDLGNAAMFQNLSPAQASGWESSYGAYGTPAGGAPANAQQQAMPNYQPQLVPFANLMQQLNQLYGNQYVSPFTPSASTGRVQPGAYQLNK